jgi:hypothetical protein
MGSHFLAMLTCIGLVVSCAGTSRPLRHDMTERESRQVEPVRDDVCIVGGDPSTPCTTRINEFVTRQSELARLRGRSDASKFLLYFLESTEKSACFASLESAVRMGQAMGADYMDYCDSLFTVGPFRRRRPVEEDGSELSEKLKPGLESMYELGWEQVAPYPVLKNQFIASWKGGCAKLLLQLDPMPSPEDQRRIVDACLVSRPDLDRVLGRPAAFHE